MPVQTGAAKTRANETDAMRHSTKVRELITQLVGYLRTDVRDVNDPKAKALFETSAETLLGMRKAFEDFEKGSEDAWKKAS
jgi:hypothetical protein